MRSRVLAAAVVLTLLGGAKASATFPGRDGRIALVVSVGCEDYAADDDPCHAALGSDVVTVAPSGREARSIVHCPGVACPGGVHQRLAYSPDGTRLAVER